ncbi:hypothetical protein BJX76DRAFT_10193 [Aspergillus varians]
MLAICYFKGLAHIFSCTRIGWRNSKQVMAAYYIHVPLPEERGGLTPNELVSSGMPSYFGVRDWATDPKNVPDSCILCWARLGPGSAYRRLPCSHVFHLDCIDRWLCGEDASCPLCRRTFYYLRRPRRVFIPSQCGNHGEPESPLTFDFKAVKAWFVLHFLRNSSRH